MAANQQTQRPLSSLTESLSHLLDMVEAFKAFDSDNDGHVTAEELGGILSSIGYNASQNEVREMMHGGSLLSMEDFLAVNARGLDLGGFAGQLRAALAELDGEEEVDAEELHQALMGGLSFEECMQIVEALDGDGNGAANLEDLQLVMQALL